MQLRVSTPDNVTLYKLANGKYGLIIADVRDWAASVSDDLNKHPFVGVILNKDFTLSCKVAWQVSGLLWSYPFGTESDIIGEYTEDIPDFTPSYAKDTQDVSRFIVSSYVVNTVNVKPYTYYNLPPENGNKALIVADLTKFKCIRDIEKRMDKFLGFTENTNGKIYNYLSWGKYGFNYRYSDANLNGVYTSPTKEEAIIQKAQDSIENRLAKIEDKIERLHRFMLEKFP